LGFIFRRSLAIPEGLGVFAGCLCCSTEADVVGAVTKLLEVGGEIDHVVIECSGMAEVLVPAANQVC
jgi:G3E family GTPase